MARANIHSWGPEQWAAAAERAGARHGLNPHIFRRQMSTESIGFRRDVIFGKTASPAGAKGIAQMMDATAAAWGVNPLHPRQALDKAAEKMAGYVRKYGSYEKALRAYNAGEGAIEKSRGYAETNNYVRQILRGHDPGKLSAPQRGGGAGGGGGGPQGAGGGAVGPDLGSGSTIAATLAAALQETRGTGVGASAPAAPAFSARPVAASTIAPAAGVAPAGGRSDIGSLLGVVAASVDQSQVPGQAQQGGVERRQQQGGRPGGRTLYIGDSLGVGTEPHLKKLLGGHVDANVVGGRSSENGIAALKHQIGTRGYKRIVLDLGTNDMTADQLARSVQRARKLAPAGVQIFIPTLNGPFATKRKNEVLQRIARNDPRIQLVPWHSKSQGHLAGDGIHATPGGYQSRAQLIAEAMGFKAQQPARAAGKVKIVGPNPGRVHPLVKNFAEQVAAVYGRPLTASDGSGHSRLTTDGNVSEHTTGDAVDIPLAGRELIRAGRAALVAAGWSPARARRVSGGLFNVYQTVNGHRVRHQIIFNTQEGGDHTDHLHISAAYR